jgi:hypothetical protein
VPARRGEQRPSVLTGLLCVFWVGQFLVILQTIQRSLSAGVVFGLEFASKSPQRRKDRIVALAGLCTQYHNLRRGPPVM